MAQKALLVGINDYKGINDLSGCINDVTNMRHVLRTYFGFKNEDIRMLVDKRATKDDIISRLKNLVASSKPGDCMVFHFSGHGSQIRDREGDELKDHMDELICPYDMNWDNGFITDDNLKAIFDKLPSGVQLEVFLDCCHSGTGLRNSDLGRPAELGPENPTRNRFLPPPVDIQCRAEGEEDDLKAVRGFKSKERSTLRHILWAGCRDNQTSADAYINGAYNGAFTYYFCRIMRDTAGNISRKDLLSRIRASLRHGQYSQIPQLECEAKSKDGKVLSRGSKK